MVRGYNTNTGGCCRGFTFLEIMLVIVIVAILSAVVVPNMAKSIKGNRLRSASRTVISSGKYARSLAVMRQKEMVLTFDLDANRVVTHGFSSGSEAESLGDEFVDGDSLPAPEVFIEGEEAPPAIQFATSELERDLDKVSVELVRLGDGSEITAGECHVLYYPNGRCDTYEVLLRDKSGLAMHIQVDPLSGVESRRLGE
jgi:prepilin-type N-terminal cleavage/methylation domain-containing protein